MLHPVGAGLAGRGMLIWAISTVASVLWWVIIIDAVLSFIPSIDRRHPIVMLIRGITEPLYRPIRKVMPAVRMGDVALDLSPIIVLIGIQILAGSLIWIIKHF